MELNSASGAFYNSLKVWAVNELNTRGRLEATLDGHTSHILSVAWSSDGEILASGSADNTLKLWDVTDGDETATLYGHTSSVMSVAWSPDGATIVSASDNNTLKLWDVGSG